MLDNVTVIIPYYEDAARLDTIMNRPLLERFKEVIVIDDSSTNRTALPIVRDAVDDFGGNVRLFRVMVNYGFNAHGCRNLGATEANTEWLLFLDADMKVNQEISPEEFFKFGKDYIAVHHPCHYNTGTGTFERRLESEACVTGEQQSYYQGCLWGGRIESVIPMMKLLRDRVDKDYENGIIALWHDESHLNRFFIENQDEVNALPPDYAFPECFPNYPYEQKIIHLAKDNSSYQV